MKKLFQQVNGKRNGVLDPKEKLYNRTILKWDRDSVDTAKVFSESQQRIRGDSGTNVLYPDL